MEHVSSSTDARRVANQVVDDAEVSTTWNTDISVLESGICEIDDVWLNPLINLIKIGRLFCMDNETARNFYFNAVFPKFDDRSATVFMFPLIVNAMSGEIKYYQVTELLESRVREDIENKKMYYLYLKVFRALGNDTSHPEVEFYRIFDLKSLKTMKMSVDTRDDELQETPALTAAKWCSEIPDDRGSLTLYGTNVLFVDNDRFASLASRISPSLANNLRRYFRVLESSDAEALRFSRSVDNVEIYITLRLINASWMFDTDIAGTYINISSEPYPYDALCDVTRLCVSIYIPDESFPKRRHMEINESIVSVILRSIQNEREGERTHSAVVSHFTNYPLVAYAPHYRQIGCDTYRFHKYLQRYRDLDRWTINAMAPINFPSLLQHNDLECAFVIYRPPLHSIELVPPTNPPSRVAHIFTRYWSPEDILEVHCKVESGVSRSDIYERFRNARKTTCFKIHNGYLTMLANNDDDYNDVTKELYEKYFELLHLWIGTVSVLDGVCVIKTWRDDEQNRLLDREMSSKRDARAYLQRTITSTDKFYVVKNTFSGKTNLSNVYETSDPSRVFTLFFDYPVKFFDTASARGIEIEQIDSLTRFETVDSLELAERLFTFDEQNDLLEISPEKYALCLNNLPAVVFIGKDWNEKDAVKLTTCYGKLSRNVIQSVQSILCRSTINECIVGSTEKRDYKIKNKDE